MAPLGAGSHGRRFHRPGPGGGQFRDESSGPGGAAVLAGPEALEMKAARKKCMLVISDFQARPSLAASIERVRFQVCSRAQELGRGL
eukprot:3712665-Pyramimonas_sp.AAC.1